MSPHRRAPLGSAHLHACSFRWVFPHQPQPPWFSILQQQGWAVGGWWAGEGRGHHPGLCTCRWSCVGRTRNGLLLRPRGLPEWPWGLRGARPGSEWGSRCLPGWDSRGAIQHGDVASAVPAPLSPSCPPVLPVCVPGTASTQATDAWAYFLLWSWALGSWQQQITLSRAAFSLSSPENGPPHSKPLAT